MFPAAVLPRRPPFGDNPRVGASGTRTQQRILRAALEVFGEVGYHACGIDRITAQADCSRPAFYQYFSSKEDLFRALSGELARRLLELTGRPDRIGSDGAGWSVLRDFVGECGTVFDEYFPLFAVFSTAEAVDDAVASGSARVFRRQAANLIDRIDRKGLRTRRLDLVTSVLLDGLWRAHRFRRSLAHADAVQVTSDRLDDALTDVAHRALYGQRPGINVRAHLGPALMPIAGAAPGWSADGAEPPSSPAARRTRSRLLDAGREVFVAQGYHDARVDDIVERAETSHGTFYRYFGSKDDLFRILAARSGRVVVEAVERLRSTVDTSDAVSTADLRTWLRPYFRAYEAERPILRSWVEASWADQALRQVSPGEVAALQQRLARFLAPRRFGDIDADALVLMALLDRSLAFSAPEGPGERAVVDAFAEVMQHGLLIVP